MRTCQVFAAVLLGGCSLLYDFDDLAGLPCGDAAPRCARGFICVLGEGDRRTCETLEKREEGAICASDAHCKAGLLCDEAFCAEDAENCVRRCRLSCPPNDMYSCANPSQWCTPGREAPETRGFCQDGNCLGNGDCASDEICVRDDFEPRINTGVCTKSCDPFDVVACGAEQACGFWFGMLNQAGCTVRGTTATGNRCDDGSICEAGSVCDPAPTQAEPDQAVCSKLCDPAGVRASCEAPNPTCLTYQGFNLGRCVSACDPLVVGQCTTAAPGQAFSCQPLNNAQWSCGDDGLSCQCAAACAANGDDCEVGGACGDHSTCPVGTLCSATAICRPICSTRDQSTPCQPLPGIPQPTCQGIGDNPAFGICE